MDSALGEFVDCTAHRPGQQRRLPRCVATDFMQPMSSSICCSRPPYRQTEAHLTSSRRTLPASVRRAVLASSSPGNENFVRASRAFRSTWLDFWAIRYPADGR